jgi:hypothetical protein
MSIPINDLLVLERMAPITLDEMDNIHLMERIDFKFVAPVSLLPQLLEEMAPYFKVQIHNGKRVASYSTKYLDTPDLNLFVMHQNGKLNRQKIRIRTYLDSQVSFLEIKNKNNKGRTSKIRVPSPLSQIQSIEELELNKSFLTKHSLFDSHILTPSLSNRFSRITMVNNEETERITMDFDLCFTNYQTGFTKEMENVLVLELKQDGWQRSDFRDILNRLRIKQFSFSKYCMGTALTNPGVKYNRFKSKWIIINKLAK